MFKIFLANIVFKTKCPSYEMRKKPKAQKSH